jgi:flavin-dependent dehydrogenase
MADDSALETFDAVVVGGGPAGATAAADLARRGRSVLLLDRAGRIKPCGGAIPPRALGEFGIPESLLVARATGARIISPADREVQMPIDDGGFVGMVDREVFDEWLRDRATAVGATRRAGTFENLARDADGTAIIEYRPQAAGRGGELTRVRARAVIGADGALSAWASRRGSRGPTRCPTSSPTTRSSARRRPASTARAATSTTRASSRPTSTPGSSRTATPAASAPAAPTRASRCAAPWARCARRPA